MQQSSSAAGQETVVIFDEAGEKRNKEYLRLMGHAKIDFEKWIHCPWLFTSYQSPYLIPIQPDELYLDDFTPGNPAVLTGKAEIIPLHGFLPRFKATLTYNPQGRLWTMTIHRQGGGEDFALHVGKPTLIDTEKLRRDMMRMSF